MLLHGIFLNVILNSVGGDTVYNLTKLGLLDYETAHGIYTLCKKFGCNNIILFGSRARGEHTPTSDVDIAVENPKDYDKLYAELVYNDFTLLPIDVINLDSHITADLRQEIENDGICLEVIHE